MEALVIASLEADDTVEVVERKGVGHPDTICDALAETFSRNLCRAYRERFGGVLHHNVDKALLCGGRAAPKFGGGTVLEPIDIYLAGRATSQVGNDAVPIADIAVEGSRAWLRDNIHALDIEHDVALHALVQPGSGDLQQLFSRGSRNAVPLANDTSFGVGYAPLSPLERLVLDIERHISGRSSDPQRPAWGEDVKVMGIRNGASVSLTVACAMVGRYVANVDSYFGETSAIETAVRELAAHHGFTDCEIAVNAADDRPNGSVYLTVTGTSAEAGDDGQVGRGNRINGVITPLRPMSLEAAAGKNPVSHVGKIYNVLARNIAETVCAEIATVAAAHCLIVSRIGTAVTTPALLHLKLRTTDGYPVADAKPRVAEIAAEHLRRVPDLIDGFIAGTIDVY